MLFCGQAVFCLIPPAEKVGDNNKIVIYRGDWYMPTYEYLCQTCSHRFETWQKMTEEPLSICPECGGHIRRVLYAAGVIFKGSGFYITDHKGEHPAAAKSEAKKEEGAKPQSAESKPAESSASAPKETSSSGDNKASSAA